MLSEDEIKKEMASATRMKSERIKSILRSADEVTNDPKKEERLKEQLCVSCFYRVSIAGQRFTYRNCMICESEMQFSSTKVDKICQKCANEINACKHCMAEI